MATKESKLIVSLVDRLTGPTRAMAGALDRLTAAQQRNNARLAAMRGRMLEAGAVAYGLARAVAAPVEAATEFETKLEDIGQKIDLPVAQLPRLGQELRKVARETTQTAAAISEGMDVLAGMGASKDDALGLLGPIGRAATAYNASIADLSQAGYAALSNLKVPANEFGNALDAMAQAGKAGAFELKDMAQYFPQLGAAYQGLGQRGVPAVADLAAALQIVRKGTGDSASAATNLNNILQKIYAPATVRAFKKMGVNIRKEMAKAEKEGKTPIEAIAEITNKVLKGDLSKLGDIFQDAQVQAGLRPLIQNLEEYRRIRAEALAARGVVEADYERRLQTGAAATQRWRVALEGLNLSLGRALLPSLTSLANDLIPIVDRMADWTDAHPGLTRAIVGTTAALIGLRVAAVAAQFSLLWMRGGLITVAIGSLRGLSGALGVAGRAFTAFRAAATGATMLGAVGGGGLFSGLIAGAGSAVSAVLAIFAGFAAGLAAVTAPVWVTIAAIVAAVAAAALAIYNYWVPISEFVTGFVGVVGGALSELATTIGAFGARIATAVGGWAVDRIIDVAGLLGIDEAAVRAAVDGALAAISGFASEAIAVIKGIPSAVTGWISDIFTMNTYSAEATAGFRSAGEQAGQALVDAVKSAVTGASSLADVGAQMAQSLWDGVKGVIDQMVAWFSTLPSRIAAAIGSINIGNLIRWPQMPSWLGGGGGGNAGASSPAINTMLKGMDKRADGGPIRAGVPYLTGELGPEIILPRHNGFVVPNGALRGAASSTAAAAPASRTLNVDLGGITIYATTNASPNAIGDAVGARVRNAIEGYHADSM